MGECQVFGKNVGMYGKHCLHAVWYRALGYGYRMYDKVS